jgi:hypothetical protein
MKLAVSHDDAGNITTLFDPAKLQGKDFSTEYVPARGEMHHQLEVPKGFDGKSVQELARLLHVTTSGGAPRLEAKA